MFLFEQITSIIVGLTKNKLRVFLTMLGIIVGICSVMLIISVGSTATNVVKMYFTGSFGGNRIVSYVKAKNGKDFSLSYDEIIKLSESDPIYEGALFENDTVYNGKAFVDNTHYSNAYLKSVSSVYSEVCQLVIENGRFLNESDCKNHSSSAVISDVTAECCFGSAENAIGKSFSIKTDEGLLIDLVVVGVYQVNDTSGKLEKLKDRRKWRSDIFCAYEYMQYINNVDLKTLKFNTFSLVTKKDIDMDAAVAKCSSYMSSRSNDRDYSFFCKVGSSDVDDTNGIVTLMIFMFIAAAILSLIVGGISLMNTLLVTVKERTKEIGTRKAIGASNSSIVGQFILESIIICLIACIIGIAISGLIVVVLNKNLNSIFNMVTDPGLRSFLKKNDVSIELNILAVISSMVFSITVGIIFGVYPSLKAAKMPITEALRYE